MSKSIITASQISGSLVGTGSFGTLTVQDVTPKAFGLTIANNVNSGFSSYTDYQILLHDTGNVNTSYGIGIRSNHMVFNSDNNYDFRKDNSTLFRAIGDGLVVNNDVSASGNFITTATGSFGSIHTTGNVGIGTTSPVQKLHIEGNIVRLDKAGTDGGYYLYDSSNNFRYAIFDNNSQTQIYADGNGTTPYIVMDSNKLGIGTTSLGDEKLTVTGNVGITGSLHVSGNISTSGSIIAKEFKTEFISSSIIYSSGSNQFGDTIDDTHKFTGSIELTGSTTIDGDITGSILSTGSFGRVHTTGTIKSDTRLEIGSNSNFLTDQLKVSDGTRDIRLNANHSSNAVIGTVGAHDFNLMTGNTFRITIDGSDGGVQTSGSIVPFSDNAVDIGSSSKRFQDVFAVQTTVGAVFETGLRSKGIGKEETGTIVVWRNGKLVPCDKSEDTMVMGVVKQGKDEPIVMGAEPVLVTGDVKEGDFITTSTKLGHGKKIESRYLLKKEMFGKVIAQALEDSTGESSLIKCMIRKM